MFTKEQEELVKIELDLCAQQMNQALEELEEKIAKMGIAELWEALNVKYSGEIELRALPQ